MYSYHSKWGDEYEEMSPNEINKWVHTILEGDEIESNESREIILKEIVERKFAIQMRNKLKSNRYKKKSDGYKKISLDEILQIAKENGGRLKFMFARQIAPYNIETTILLSYIKKIINEDEDKVEEVTLDILQWGDDKVSSGNIEKWIFIRPEMLYSKLQYHIAFESKGQIKKGKHRIGDIDLDVYRIIKMIHETGLEYMEKSLNHLENEGKVKDDGVNILDFWGLTTLYYIGERSKDIFGINNYEIKEFKDKIKLANGDEFDISGYELIFKYKGKELKFRVYDASHIYEKESKKYKTRINPYITLALLSGNGYILVGKPSVSLLIKHFYKEARKKTGYDILLLVVDEQPLVERGIIGKKDYVKFIDKDKNKKFIDTISNIYGI